MCVYVCVCVEVEVWEVVVLVLVLVVPVVTGSSRQDRSAGIGLAVVGSVHGGRIARCDR